MTRLLVVFIVFSLAATQTPFISTTSAEDKKHDAHMKAMEDCAKACQKCQYECDMCSRYCLEMLTAGKKEHLLTIGTCADCALFCSTAAHIVSRGGPMSTEICESCAKACDLCGTACEKFPEDAHMKKCAEECRRCAKACKEMVKHMTKSTESR
jgi:hypothetical protein